jgi:hypothetical protein
MPAVLLMEMRPFCRGQFLFPLQRVGVTHEDKSSGTHFLEESDALSSKLVIKAASKYGGRRRLEASFSHCHYDSHLITEALEVPSFMSNSDEQQRLFSRDAQQRFMEA